MPAKKGSPLPLAALIGAALLALLLSILALANPVASQLEHDDLSARAAKKTYQRAPFCLKGSKTSNCCCANRDKKAATLTVWAKTWTKVRTITSIPKKITTTKKKKARSYASPDLINGSDLDLDTIIGHLEPRAAVADPDSRNLCSVCPKGVSLLPVGSKTSQGSKPVLCCPARKTVTKTRKGTWIKSITKTVTSARKATLKGKVWYDIDKNGKFSQPPDVPIKSTVIVITIPKKKQFLVARQSTVDLVTTTTDSGGNFNVEVPPQDPGTVLTVYKETDRNDPLSTVTVTSGGGGQAAIPIPRPAAPLGPTMNVINNTVTVRGKGVPGNKVILYANGTEIGRVDVQADGIFTVPSSYRNSGAYDIKVSQQDSTGAESDLVSLGIARIPDPPKVSSFTQSTNVAQLTGTGKPGATVNVYSNGKFVGAALCDASGNWKMGTYGLPVGTSDITVRQEDDFGISDPTPAGSVVVATAGPNPPTWTKTVPLNTTNGTAAVVSGKGAAGATINVYADGVLVGTTTVATSGSLAGTWKFTSLALPPGVTNFTITQTTATGTSTVVSAGGVDVSAPLIWTNTKLLDPDQATVSGKGYPGATVKLYSNGTYVGESVVKSDGTFGIDSSALDPGLNQLTVVQTKPDGKTETVTAGSVLIAAPPPPTPPPPPPPGGSPANLAWTTTTLSGSKGVASGTGEPGSTIKLFEGSTQVGTGVVGADGKWTVTTADLPTGTHVFTATQTLAGGNPAGTPSSVTGPVSAGQVTIPPNGGSLAWTTTTLGGSSFDQAVINGTGEAGATIKIFNSSNIQVGTAVVGADGKWSIATSSLPMGDQTFTATQTLAGGNPAGTPTSVTGPVSAGSVHIYAPIVWFNTTLSDATDVATITGTAEPGAIVSIRNSSNPSQVFGTTVVAANGTWTFDSAALPLGTHDFIATQSITGAPAGLPTSIIGPTDAGEVVIAIKVTKTRTTTATKTLVTHTPTVAPLFVTYNDTPVTDSLSANGYVFEKDVEFMMALSDVLESGDGLRTFYVNLPRNVSLIKYSLPPGFSASFKYQGSNSTMTFNQNTNMNNIGVLKVTGTVNGVERLENPVRQGYYKRFNATTGPSLFAPLEKGGDTWSVYATSQFVYGAWHAYSDNFLALDCRERLSGQRCKNWSPWDTKKTRFEGYMPGYKNRIWVTDNETLLWTLAYKTENWAYREYRNITPVVLCFNVSETWKGVTPKMCDLPGFPLEVAPKFLDYPMDGISAAANTLFFGDLVITLSVYPSQLSCFNRRSRTLCPHHGYALDSVAPINNRYNWNAQSHAVPLDSERLLVKTENSIRCLFAANFTLCPGSIVINTTAFNYTNDNGRSYKPLVGNSADVWDEGQLYPPSPYMDKDSKKVEGFCFPETGTGFPSTYIPGVCMSFDGILRYAPNVSSSTWVNPWEYLSPRNLTYTWWYPSGWRNWGQYDIVGTRAYLFLPGQSDGEPAPKRDWTACWDYATQSLCAGLPARNSFGVYSVYTMFPQEFDNPDQKYFWWAADSGYVGCVDVTNWGDCPAPPDKIMISPGALDLNHVCAWDSTVAGWNTFKLEGLVGNNFAANKIYLTLTDSVGNPVSASWNNVPVTIGTEVDIRSVSFADRPNFLLTFQGMTGTIQYADIIVTFDGHPVQTCFWFKAKESLSNGTQCLSNLTFTATMEQNMTAPYVYRYTSSFQQLKFTAKQPSAPSCALNYTIVSEPGAVQALTASNKATASVTVSFQPPASNGGSAITYFEYSINAGGSWITLTDATFVSGTWSAVVKGPVNSVSVRAVNFVGPGPDASA